MYTVLLAYDPHDPPGTFVRRWKEEGGHRDLLMKMSRIQSATLHEPEGITPEGSHLPPYIEQLIWESRDDWVADRGTPAQTAALASAEMLGKVTILYRFNSIS